MNTDQPFIDRWPMWDEPLSKIPAPVDVEAARVRLARRFNVRGLPKHVEIDLAWAEHERITRSRRTM